MENSQKLAVFAALWALLVLPAVAHAIIGNGTARLVSVTAVDGGCVYGPTGPFVQSWDVEPGHTYTVTITNVTECANGGTGPTVNIRVKGSTGNTDLVAVYVSPGVYQFNYTLPADAVCTYPILYCVDFNAPGQGDTGFFVIRNDGANYQAHLRASTFGPGCTNPTEIVGPECETGTQESTWGAMKTIYR